MSTNKIDITSANATAVLVVKDLFPAGIELQGFATDQSISQDSQDITETRMGVDGKMVAGYVPGISPVTIMLEASSPSFESLGALWSAMTENQKVYECDLTVTVPSRKLIFTWTTGVLKSGVPFPSLKKVLDPTTWVFHFEKFEKGKA